MNSITAKFVIHTALHEESSSGWVWSKIPNFDARRLVKICNPKTGRSIFCEYREIDRFFEAKYNDSRPTSASLLSECTNHQIPLVISLWYRRELGIEGCGERVELTFSKAERMDVPQIRAGAIHPDVIVRLATNLAVISVWLGIQSIAISALSFSKTPFAVIPVVLEAGLTLALCGWICKW